MTAWLKSKLGMKPTAPVVAAPPAGAAPVLAPPNRPVPPLPGNAVAGAVGGAAGNAAVPAPVPVVAGAGAGPVAGGAAGNAAALPVVPAPAVAPPPRRKPITPPVVNAGGAAPPPVVPGPTTHVPLAAGDTKSIANPFADAWRQGKDMVSDFQGKTTRKEKAGLVYEKAGNLRERTLDNANAAYEIPGAWEELAESLQIVTEGVMNGTPDVSDAESFADAGGASEMLGATGVLGLAGDLTETFTSGVDVFKGGKNLKTGWTKYGIEDHANPGGMIGGRDSITRNLGAQQMESGVTGLLGGSSGAAVDIMDIADLAADVAPFVGGARMMGKSVLDAKAMTEDAVAAERSRKQKVRVKRDLDQQLPEDYRLDRLDEFLGHYTNSKSADKAVKSSAKLKWGESKRWDKTLADYTANGAAGAPAAFTGKLDDKEEAKQHFLNWLKTRQVDGKLDAVKDFGYGTKYRKEFEKDFKTNRDATGVIDTKHEQYNNMRNLGKMASFAHRRKAETATLHGVDALGNAADGIGEFTAAGDYGATKAFGKGVKALKAGYTGLKTFGKRARRVHKLRTTKNEMGYGGRQDRGFWWGTKAFFTGNVADQMDTARASLQGDKERDAAGAKKHTAQLDPKRKRELIRRVTLQCQRRIDDMIKCLISPDDSVRYRARRIVHILAESNLSGGISKIYDSDLDRLRTHYLRSNALDDKGVAIPNRTAANPWQPKTPLSTEDQHLAQYTKQVKSLREILSKHLEGVGG